MLIGFLFLVLILYIFFTIEPQCALGSQPPSKTPPPLSCYAPLNQQTAQDPLFRQSLPPSLLVFRDRPPPFRSWIFQ